MSDHPIFGSILLLFGGLVAGLACVHSIFPPYDISSALSGTNGTVSFLIFGVVVAGNGVLYTSLALLKARHIRSQNFVSARKARPKAG